ncbi:MAG: hypothetical protein M3277_12935, partial [Actinomycetota bacterium]|nr:hypothetical protein [Actinomycetota bacterium]
MIHDQTTDEVIRDLLRSAWIIERARSDVYSDWSANGADLMAAAEGAVARADVVAAVLAERGIATDEVVVAPHADWMRSLAGDTAEEVPLGRFFLARLGDWVDGHCKDFLGDGADRLVELGNAERATLEFPSELPEAPPFEPVETLEVGPPGDVLFRFGILADLHFGSSKGGRAARAAIADLNASGAELVI